MKKLQTALYVTLLVALLAGCSNRAAVQQATATAEAHSTAVALLAQQVQQTGTAASAALQRSQCGADAAGLLLGHRIGHEIRGRIAFLLENLKVTIQLLAENPRQ